jgi:heat shock protein HslJ
LLDAKPMKGSKRVPILTIGAKGEAAIDLWCNSVQAQLLVAGGTITIVPGEKTEKQCDPARMKGDDDLLEALTQVTNWRRNGQVLTLSGGKTLRFRSATN